MKYWGPINSTGGINGNDGYADGNATTGAEGSIPSFSGFEQTLRALSNLVVSSGRTPGATINDFQLTDVIRSQRVNWAGTFGGTANGLTSTFSPAPGSAAELVGVPLTGIAAFTNTGAATYSPNGFSGPIKWPDGTALVGGEIHVGEIITLRWDGAKYQLFTGSSNRINWSAKLPGFWSAQASGTPGYTNLGNTVWTKINVDQEDIDTEGWYDPTLSRFQPTQPGYYYISAGCSFGSNTNWSSGGLRAFKNGSITFSGAVGVVPGTHYAGYGNGMRAMVGGLTQLNGTTDYIEFYGFQDLLDSSGGRKAAATQACGWFMGV